MKAVLCSLAIAAMLVPSAKAMVVMNEIDLANNRVELTNTGGSNVNISGWWLCNRVNGSPFYDTLASAATLNGGLSTGTSLSAFQPGEILVLDIAANFLPDGNGEFAFYNTNSFTSASAIEDYVLWGANGIRDLVAANAGIWIDNNSISVAGLGVGDTLQLGLGLPGNSAADYVVAPGTIGAANVPEPSRAVLLGLGLTSLLLRRRR